MGFRPSFCGLLCIKQAPTQASTAQLPPLPFAASALCEALQLFPAIFFAMIFPILVLSLNLCFTFVYSLLLFSIYAPWHFQLCPIVSSYFPICSEGTSYLPCSQYILLIFPGGLCGIVPRPIECVCVWGQDVKFCQCSEQSITLIFSTRPPCTLQPIWKSHVLPTTCL